MPFIDVPGNRLEKQQNNTSCWISVAHFVSLYFPHPSSREELLARFQHVPANAHDVMAGAGNPVTVLQALGFRCEKVAAADVDHAALFTRIRASIAAGLPVMCFLRAGAAFNWFRHGVVITGVDATTGEVRLKDPAREPTDIQQMREVVFRDLVDGNFLYGTYRPNQYEARQVYAYVTHVVFTQDQGRVVFAADRAIPAAFRRPNQMYAR
ncbi:MAG: papain-like cysteine protease family protein [Byssovorax sp.]